MGLFNMFKSEESEYPYLISKDDMKKLSKFVRQNYSPF